MNKPEERLLDFWRMKDNIKSFVYKGQDLSINQYNIGMISF